MDEVMKIIYENNDKKNKKMPILLEDTIDYIKTYTGEIKIRNGVYMRQIPKNDQRYTMLKKRPLIKHYRNTSTDNNKKGFAWWKVNDKFMMITVSNMKKVFYNVHENDYFVHEYFYNNKRIYSIIK
jgi:hypothetical protein